MDCVLKSSDQTIKGRLTHYMFLLVFTASLFMLIVLQFMLESSELSQGVLSVIGDGQDFFDEIIDLQNLTEHILLYDDEQSMETVTQTFHTANEALEMLKRWKPGKPSCVMCWISRAHCILHNGSLKEWARAENRRWNFTKQII